MLESNSITLSYTGKTLKCNFKVVISSGIGIWNVMPYIENILCPTAFSVILPLEISEVLKI